MKPRLDRRGITITLWGQFNPAILHPAWFGKFDLIKPAEVQNAKIEVVHPEITEFSTDWFGFDVTQDRLNLRSEQEAYFEPLRDLIVGTFRLLTHTPLRSLSLGNHYHFTYDDPKASSRVLHRLVPLTFWNEEIGNASLHTLKLTFPRKDERSGGVVYTVEPSRVLANGLFVSTDQILSASQYKEEPTKLVYDAQIVTVDLVEMWDNVIESSTDTAFTIASLEQRE